MAATRGRGPKAVPERHIGTLIPTDRDQVPAHVKEALASAFEVLDSDRDLSKNTREAYRKGLAHFIQWAGGKDVVSFPIHPAAAVAYLQSMRAEVEAGDLSLSTIRVRLAALAHAQAKAGGESLRTEPLRRLLRVFRMELGQPARGRQPIDLSLLHKLGEAWVDPLPEAECRARAILLLGFAGAFRRSEIAALTLADLVLTRQGMEITLRRSKTDQEGKGRLVGILRTGTTYCPAHAVSEWLALRGQEAGSLFGVTDKTIYRIVRRAAAWGGFDPKLFGGHSLRAGFATEAARNGYSLEQIARQTGHANLQTLKGYVRRANLYEDNPSAILGHR